VKPSVLAALFAAALTAALPAAVLAGVLAGGCRRDVLAAVERSGKLVVGTSSDLPPYEFRDKDGRLQGLDIDLMSEIAGRLGVSVEWKDMKAADLPAALDRGEVDAVIADLVPGADKADRAAFTEPYLMTPEVVVTSAGSSPPAGGPPAASAPRVPSPPPVQLKNLAELARYRVGVEARTPEEKYCRDELVATGAMPETSLSVYPTARAALDELVKGRLDAAFVDKGAAAGLVASGELTVLLETRLPHDPAIAVGPGQDALLARLNEIIEALHREGFVAGLAEKYGIYGE